MNKKLLRKIEKLAALTRQELTQFVKSVEDFDDDWACSCLVCSWVLEKVLKAHGIKAELCIGKYDDCHHAFVMVDEYVVDITATQFWRAGVIIEEFEGSDYKSNFKGIKAHRHISSWPCEQIPTTYKKELLKIFRKIMKGK